MIRASGNSHDHSKTWRHPRTYDAAVTFQGEAVAHARGNGHYIAPSRHIGSTTGAPRDYSSVAL